MVERLYENTKEVVQELEAAQQKVVKQIWENLQQEAITIAEKKCEEFDAFVSDVNDDVTQINKLVEELYQKFTLKAQEDEYLQGPL